MTHILLKGLMDDDSPPPLSLRTSSLSLRHKSKKAPPPKLPGGTAVQPITPVRAGTLSRSEKKKKAAPPPLPKPHASNTSAPAPAPAPATPMAPATAAAAAPAVAAPAEEKPKRRKLVRGGNKFVAKVLPEYTDAINALAELDQFLDMFESTDKALAEKDVDVHGSISGNLKRRSTIVASQRRRSQIVSTRSQGPGELASEADIKNLENLLLIGEQGASEQLGGGGGSGGGGGGGGGVDRMSMMPVSPSKEATMRFMDAATAAGGHRTMSSRDGSNVNVKGYKLAPEDLLNMDESERIAILNKVKGGGMSINEALAEVIEHKKRQNCVIC